MRVSLEWMCKAAFRVQFALDVEFWFSVWKFTSLGIVVKTFSIETNGRQTILFALTSLTRINKCYIILIWDMA